jgi:hypothetical protein
MSLKVGILAVSALLASQAASAQTLQGTYLLTYTETCQATFSWGTDPSTGDINTINSVDNGKISTTVGTAVFDPSTHQVKITGYQTKGDLLIIQEHGGNPIAAGKSNMVGKYSTTPDFLNIAGNQFRAFYSPSTGTATSVVFGGIDGSNATCAVTGTGTLATPSP